MGGWSEAVTPVLPDDQRVMPPTGSHEEVSSHRLLCSCVLCAAYPRELISSLRRKAIR